VEIETKILYFLLFFNSFSSSSGVSLLTSLCLNSGIIDTYFVLDVCANLYEGCAGINCRMLSEKYCYLIVLPHFLIELMNNRAWDDPQM
jgi:hypothetical protein